MANEHAVRLAKQILEDLNSGYGYYNDANVLADLIKGSSPPSATPSDALKIAQAILDDRRGARYYDDPAILAQFLYRRG